MKKPLGDRVIVKPNAAMAVTDSGFELSSESIDRPQEGIAVAVGIRCTEPELKEGVKVTYGKFAGQQITIDEVEYLIMKESEIIAVE
mgnify:CR=1 FL=1